jgi:hypothetical protein
MPEDFDELRELLKRGGAVNFVVRKVSAGCFKKQAARINKSEKYFNRHNRWSTKLWGFIYVVYVGIKRFLIVNKFPELEKPLLVYETNWRFISRIKGEDLPEGQANIIFFGKIKINGKN